MYCSQCGAELGGEDVFCSACGARQKDGKSRTPAPAKKKGGAFRVVVFLILAAAFLIPKVMNGELTAKKDTSAPQEIAAENNAIYSGRNSCTAEPDPAALREVRDLTCEGEGECLHYYGDDGRLAAEKLIFAENCARVTWYDPYGNILAVFEYDDVMGVYLEYYYDNIYDGQGRLVYRCETNSRGAVGLEEMYTYNPDGSYTLDLTEYRGAWVYIWDYEASGSDNPVIQYQAVIVYDAGGREISRTEQTAN